MARDGRYVPEIDFRLSQSDEVNVMPSWGPEHENSPFCWCDPYLSYKDPDTDGEVWVHRRADN